MYELWYIIYWSLLQKHTDYYMCFNFPPNFREGKRGGKEFGTYLHCNFFPCLQNFHSFHILQLQEPHFQQFSSSSASLNSMPLKASPGMSPWPCFNRVLTLSITCRFKNHVFERSFVNQMWISHFLCLCFLWCSMSWFIRNVFYVIAVVYIYYLLYKYEEKHCCSYNE